MSVNVRIEERNIIPVQNYKYLGVVVTNDEKGRTEVLKRFGMAMTSFNSMRKVLNIMNLSMKIRL